MNCKLTNLKTLHTNRWQQDDTPCFVPFPSQSIKYWITTLLLAMMSIVGAWAEPVTITDPYDSEWCFVIASQGSGTIKSSIDNNTFKFLNYVDRSGTRITGELNQDDITALAGLTYPSGYPTFLDMKAVTFVENVNITLNSIFKGLRLPYGTDFSVVPASIDYAFYSNYTKVNYNDGNNENVPIYLYLNSGGVNSAIEKLGDYLQYRTIYIKGTYTDADINALTSAKNGVIVKTAEESGGGEGGDDPVDTTSLDYKIANRLQLTNAPTIYIDLPDIGTKSLDDYLYKQGREGQTYDEAPYRRASIKVVATDDTTSPHYMESFEVDADHLEIKVRGNSTSMSQFTGHGGSEAKRPYRLKFAKKDKTTGQNFKHDMINGGYSKRNWTLLANAFDHSLIRNALTCELGKIVGMPFNPGYKFVDLVINDDYRGTYQVSDHCEIDADRIKINEDTGWYVEFQGKTQMCDYPMFFAEQGLIMNINNPEPAYTGKETTRADSAAVEQPIIDEVKEWFQNSWQKGFASGFTSPTTGWRAYNDEESLMKFWIITEITGDYDGLMSVKAYREADGKLCWGPVWDKDLAYGNYSSMASANTTLVANMSGNASSIDDYFANNFAKDPEFMTKVKAKMDQLVNGGLKTTLCNKIDELAALVAQTEKLDSAKWNFNGPGTGMEQYHKGVTGYDNYAAYIAQLKAWINSRVDYVQEQINALYTAANPADPEDLDYDVTTSVGNASLPKDALKDVTMLNRTIVANEWNAVSFPFDITTDKMKDVFGDDFELKTFTGVSDVDNTKIKFETPAEKAIVAGMPYLLKPSKAVDASPLFSGVINTYSTGYISNELVNGETIKFGDYTFAANIFSNTLKTDGTIQLIGSDAALSAPTKEETWSTTAVVGGCNAFISILNSAAVPTIVFPSDVEPVVRTQLTYLPTIYIDTKDGAAIQPSSGDWVAAGIQVMDANENLTSFTEEIGLTGGGKNIMQIRGRGTSSWTNTEKKSYRIQFGKDDKDNLGNVTKSYKHNLLENEEVAGVVKKRNWVLLANAGDKTLIRNALTSEIGDAVNLPFTPGYRFVDLVLNGNYVGTYQVTEFLEADANRINIDEDNGLFIQMTGSSDIATGDHVINGTDYTKPYLTIKNPEVKTAKQSDWNAAFNTDTYNFDAMWDATDGTGLDKESLVNWYIASEIIGNYEALSSIYAYKDVDNTELSFGPLWGNETGYDNSTSSNMTSTGLMNDLDDDNSHNGLLTGNDASKASAWKTKIQSLWSQPWFANAVNIRWNTLYNNGALTTTLKDKVDNLAAIVKNTSETFPTSSQAKNFTATADGGAGWSLAGQGITDYSKNIANDATYETEIARLKTYIETRLPYLDKKFKALDGTIEYDVTRSDAISAYSIYNGQTTNVTLKNRGTIWGGEWNAICLPFSLTDEQLTAVFGEGYELKSFKGVTEGETFNTFNFNDTQTTLDAGVPYIIKPTANVTNLTFNNVTLNLSVDKSVVEATSDKSNIFKFTGTLQPYKMADDGTDWFIGRNNKAYKSNGTLHACRAYFTMPSTQAAAKAFMFGNLITSIDNIVINDNSLENVKIYNLNGQVVGNSWNAVPQGIYIVNGKKVIK